jgi:cellulose synthase/poly-beta-1,6-N-acetylglucosamine synthase-like glycosyltransferase
MLENLLVSIAKSNLDKSLIKDINIIIVDNDVERSAEKKVEELKMHQKDIYKLQYHTYPVKGLSNVRNELLRKSLLLNPDFIVFVDDDEFVTTEWLNELIKTLLHNNADMVSGPVLPMFNHKVSKYISCWFHRPNYQNNHKINSIASGNLIINAKSLKKFNVWFDIRFNKTGSEDSYFGKQMIQKGATAYWSEKAVAYENIPEKRTSLKWLIQRWYRGSMSYTYILNLEKEHLKIFRKIISNLFYIIFGFFALSIILLPIKKKYWGILKITAGFGGLIGFFNIIYEEYK